jgi:cobyrinic acid a,c-diamide synthase
MNGRLLVSGTNSGCGKTTVTCALLAAYKARKLPLTAFKCGPDYIDPMFHRAALGIPSYNLDPFFMDRAGLQNHLTKHGGQNLCVIEGAMGYYDGIGCTDNCSAYTVAQATEAPVVLVLNAGNAGNSLTAVIEGFLRHKKDSNIRGIIFNKLSPSRYAGLKAAVEKTGIHAFGFLPSDPRWSIESRHLGLTTAAEIPLLREKLAALGKQAEETIDLDELLSLAGDRSARADKKQQPQKKTNKRARAVSEKIRIGIADDEAFCFHYMENWEILEELGCEPVFFSPLRDRALPENLQGLYLSGGYPELYTAELSQNVSMLRSIRGTVKAGLPTLAECGGFMYLHEAIDGRAMAGVISGEARKTEKLQRFGYVTLSAEKDNLLCPAGGSIRSHEFHYWESDNPGSSFTARKAGRDTVYKCAHATETLYAGFPHIYFPANRDFALSFADRMRK